MKFGLDGVQKFHKDSIVSLLWRMWYLSQSSEEFNNNKQQQKIKLIVILEYLNTFKSNVLLKMLVV